jgi:mRNA interferase MazF
MIVSRGDVVLVDFPFSSGAALKLRPAVVVQNDKNNRRLSSTILAPITSNTRYSAEATQVLIDPRTQEGASSGLLKLSAIKAENLATVELKLIRRKIGVLSKQSLTSLELALKESLALT